MKNLPVQLKELDSYQDNTWNSKKNERDFIYSFKQAAHCMYNGFVGKGRSYVNKCLEIYDADRVDTALALAKKDGKKQVRLFAVVEHLGKPIRIEGRGPFDWRLVAVDDHAGNIPLEHLERLTMLRQMGAPEPDEFVIAEPVHKPRPVRRELRDPALIARYGKWLLEIGRWD